MKDLLSPTLVERDKGNIIMIEAVITYTDKDTPPDSLTILTYLRGDGYWQFLCADGSTTIIPDSVIHRLDFMGAASENTNG